MRRDLIASLQCPYSGSRFEVTSVTRGTSSLIEYGVLCSEAGEFPIVAGVLRLLPDSLQARLVGLVQEGRFDDALRTALEMPFQGRWAALATPVLRAAQRWNLGPIARLDEPGKRRFHRLVTRRDLSFSALAEQARSERWTNWQTYRFSMPTFLPVYALSHLAKGRRAILDFGCGLGHSSFLMRRLAADAAIVCADFSFSSVYLASRFFVPDAHCICLDGDYPMPFRDGTFDLVFSTDALQYIESKSGIAREFQRVLTPDGTVALAHLHNRLSPVRAGKALTAGAYDGLFSGMCRRLYPEDSIVAEYVERGTLDLSRRHTSSVLNGALGGLSLVAANTESAFTVHEGIWDAYIDAMQYPNLNPAYRAHQSRGSMTLERGIGAPYAVERTVDGCEFLPQTWRGDISSIDRQGILALRDLNRVQLRELVRRFLVLDMPESYV
jgi:SAM-dependent methyltransferase